MIYFGISFIAAINFINYICVVHKMNSDLQIISSWSKPLGLSINSNKSQVCIFGSSKQLSKLRTPLPSIFYDNVCLEASESVRNLGIRLDGTFCWSS